MPSGTPSNWADLMLQIEPVRPETSVAPPLMPGEQASIRVASALSKLEQACDCVLALLPASLSPQCGTQIRTVLMECLSNAIVHGNLEIDSSLRAAGDWSGYNDQLQARQADPHYSQREVLLDFALRPQELFVAVEDQGPGFTPTPADDTVSIEDLVLAEAGRGLVIVRHFAKQVTFNPSGNRIELLLPLE